MVATYLDRTRVCASTDAVLYSVPGNSQVGGESERSKHYLSNIA
jgi:hypothetical protein